ncbi:MAG: hypothetical protein PUE12_00090 [Oscillospiraceae bacterium]|nr:hypothetical protein [Oscillospiraceae bacterium]
MMPSDKKITRENAKDIIKQFAREYRKELGKVPGEIIIVGGGSITLNYKFRDATQDFDMIIRRKFEEYMEDIACKNAIE